MRPARATGGSGPIAVVEVEAAEPARDLPGRRPDGSRWLGAWLVVRRLGDVLGIVEVAFDGRDHLAAGEVEQLVAPLVDATGGLQAPSAAASRRRAPLPSATVVVPTDFGRPEQLRACLVALVAMDHPDFEVVVVDNRRGAPPGDRAVEALAAQVGGVRVVRQPVPGISAARNAGVAAARGEVVAFTDDDVRVDRAWLRALSERLADRPDEDAATGLILPAQLETDAQLWFERHYGGFAGQRTFAPLSYRGAPRGARTRERSRVAVVDEAGRLVRRFALYGAGAVGAGANMAFRAETLRRLGPFDEALGAGTPARGGEDLAAFLAVLWEGGAIGYEPAAVVHHTHRDDRDALRRQLHGYGLGFTAMLTAAVVGDPRHLLGLAAQLPAAVRSRSPHLLARLHRSARGTDAGAEVVGGAPGAAGRARQVVLGPPAPGQLALWEGLGALRGPAVYLRSRWSARRGRASEAPAAKG